MKDSNLPSHPDNLVDKLSFYRKKYGVTHAVCSYIGRYNQNFWTLVAPIITKNYLKQWLNNNEVRILNLGGGSNCLKGCLTADIDPRADVYLDITKPFPLPTSSIDSIFCEEVIEHVSIEDGSRLLKECWRVLKPGGFIRITTPDLSWFSRRISEDSEDSEACCEINDIFYNHGHRFLYTRKLLQECCKETGFISFLYSSYQDPESRLGYLDSHAFRFNHLPEISQYLEAYKPDLDPKVKL